MATHPESIGRFVVLRLLGRGGMGKLYLARDPAIGRPVAIKVLRDDPENPDVRERFLREARAAGGLRHTNIVTIFDVGEHDDQPFIAMEFVDGETLQKLIRDNAPIPLGRRLELMEALCSGLAFAHRAGIVHRDVKPANIMVDSDGTLKILDFGIARAGSSGMTRTGMVLGTLSYMAPEQLSGGAVDHRSDIFSVGAVVYEWMSGRRAYPGDSEAAFLQRLHKPEPEPLASVCPDLDPDIVRIAETALQIDPARRYSDLDEMGRDIARVRRRLAPGQSATIRVRVSEVDAAAPGAGTPRTPRRPTEREELGKLRASRIADHLASAGRAFDAGNIDEALIECRQALVIDPDSAPANDLFERFQAARDERERRRVVEEADGQLARGELTRAADLADRALALGPGAADAIGLRERIDAALRARQAARDRAAAIERSLELARAALVSGDLTAAAAAAEDALSRDGSHAEAGRLRAQALAGIERRRREREEAGRRSAEVAVLLAEASDLHATGDMAQALVRARRALELEPEHVGAREWADRLGTALARQQAEAAARREAEARARWEAEAAARREAEEVARRELQAGLRREAEAAARRQAEEAARREAEAARRAAADAQRAAKAAQKAAEDARREAEARARREARRAGRRQAADAGARMPRRRAVWWVAGALLIVAAAAAAVRFGMSRQIPPPPEGQVFVQVAPWGQLESIVDRASGRQFLSARQTTPCFVTLPAGEYVVRATNPFFPKAVELTVRVEAGRTVRAEASLPEFRIDEEIETVVNTIR